MRRRDFLASGIAAAAAAGVPLALSFPLRGHAADSGFGPPPKTPDRIAGMSLPQLRDDLQDRLFNRYLPFWDQGGIDRKYGGFMCELEDDGSVAGDEKYIWYQGRGIWAYSFLYNNFGKDRRWLEIARRGRDFMVKHMYAGGGRWFEQVGRDGTLQQGIGDTVYGWLFAAEGLAEYYRAAGEKADLKLAKESILTALKTQDDPHYADTMIMLYISLDADPHGLRTLGHSMAAISILTGLLAHHADPQLEELQRRHVKLVMEKFWNPQYRIVNECLKHDYGRLPGADTHMLTGHAVETLWMVMAEALRGGDRKLFDAAAGRIRRFLEMCWDYIFDGLGDDNFRVFATEKWPLGPGFDVKTMWAHCEAMNGCMLALEHSGDDWANRWYGLLHDYSLKAFTVPQHGVWRQAVDRVGKDVKRAGISTNRKCNYHQVRYMMLNLLSLKRMIARQENRQEAIT